MQKIHKAVQGQGIIGDGPRLVLPNITANSRSRDSQKQFYPSQQELKFQQAQDNVTNDESNNTRLKSHINASEAKFMTNYSNQEVDCAKQDLQQPQQQHSSEKLRNN